MRLQPYFESGSMPKVHGVEIFSSREKETTRFPNEIKGRTEELVEDDASGYWTLKWRGRDGIGETGDGKRDWYNMWCEDGTIYTPSSICVHFGRLATTTGTRTVCSCTHTHTSIAINSACTFHIFHARLRHSDSTAQLQRFNGVLDHTRDL
jgi:hypothetical protein